MNDIKLSLTVTLPGRVPVSGEESPVNTHQEQVCVYNPITKRMEKVKVYIKNNKPAQQVLNMSSEAYQNFISNTKPYEYEGGAMEWKKLKKEEKIIWHLEQIAQSMGGEIRSFNVYDD